VISLYPPTSRARDRWILERRPRRHRLDPLRAYAALVEEERSESGEVVPVATLFLTNRECPWRCLMCDLWINTLEETVAPGSIAAQIRAALAVLPAARQIKLYNAGSFFDPKAIPRGDYAEIAGLLAAFERVIVESHPALVGDACLRFRDLLAGRLEVAMGLETVHPGVLPRLNKRMTLDMFGSAAAFLRDADVAVRAFVLLGLPFVDEDEGLHWTCRSMRAAFEMGARVVAVIPTRTGNGALDALEESGDFSTPSLSMLEAALSHGIRLGRGRVFADLWDLSRFSRCASCLPARTNRLRESNLRQTDPPRVSCGVCANGA
jgi:archaeosine synthase beta-subunit